MLGPLDGEVKVALSVAPHPAMRRWVCVSYAGTAEIIEALNTSFP
jgi:hypothetical protein